MTARFGSFALLEGWRRLVGHHLVDEDPVVVAPALPENRPLNPSASENDNRDAAYLAIEEALRTKGYLT